LHPTHRKVRDGWGTRALWADWKKGKGNDKSKSKGEGNGKGVEAG